MRGRRHATKNRTTSKLKKKVAAASGTLSGTRSSGQMIHNMDKCHNLSVPCSSEVRNVLCDIFPELSEKIPFNQSLLGQIIRNYLLQEKDKRLRSTNEQGQSKKRRKKKKKKSIEPIINQNLMESTHTSMALNDDEKQQNKLNSASKLDIFIEKLLALDKKKPNEERPNCTQKNGPPESRDLSALLKFIQCQYQEFKKHEGKILKGHPIGGFSEIPTIPLQKIQSLCERIQCQSCRQDTLRSLNETISIRQCSDVGSSSLENIKDRESLNTFVLTSSGVAIPDPVTKNWLTLPISNFNHDGNGDAHDADRAFDYVGMEEGYESFLAVKREAEMSYNIDLNDGSPHFNFFIARNEGSGERFAQLRPFEGSDKTESFPFSILDVDGIIRHIIVPCGLNELEHTDKIPLEERRSMRKEASKMIESFANKMKGLTKQMGVIQNLLHEAREPNGRFAPSESKKLRECDFKCEEYIQNFMDFLMDFHLYTSAARCAIHSEQKWLNNINDKLWEEYERAIQLLIEPSLNHRWKVIHFQEKSTSSPLMYNCTIQRSYMQDMIDEKLKILSQLNDMLDQILISPSSENGCAGDLTHLKRIVAYAVYFSNKYNMKRYHDTSHDDTSLLSSLSVSVFKTIYETNVSKVMDIQAERIKGMREQSKRLIEKLEDHREAITVQVPQKYESSWKANNILIEEKMIINDENSGKCKVSPVEFEKKELKRNCSLFENVLRQSRLLKDMKTLDLNWGDDKIDKKLVSPIFSENVDGQQLVVALFESEDSYSQTPDKCVGGGGKRRVMSIISACIYSWLQDRCMEWHADLTQKELLSAMEDECLGVNGLNVSTSKIKKSSKKKKDKQKLDVKKLTGLPIETEAELSEKENTDTKHCIADPTGNDPLIIQATLELPDDNSKKNQIPSSAKDYELGPELVSENIKMTGYITKNDKPYDNENTGDQDMPSTPQISNLKLTDELRTNVGVMCGTNYISAKDYLINRYLDLQLPGEVSYVQL